MGYSVGVVEDRCTAGYLDHHPWVSRDIRLGREAGMAGWGDGKAGSGVGSNQTAVGSIGQRAADPIDLRSDLPAEVDMAVEEVVGRCCVEHQRRNRSWHKGSSHWVREGLVGRVGLVGERNSGLPGTVKLAEFYIPYTASGKHMRDGQDV
jgi:hypothetical protein